MAGQPPVGSLDAWLPAVHNESQLTTGRVTPGARRPESPFAMAASSAHNRSHSEPVPIPWSTCPTTRPTRFSEPQGVVASSHRGSQSACQNSGRAQGSLAEALRAFDESRRCGQSQPADQMRGCHGDMEDTVRHGRRKLASSPFRCLASSQPTNLPSAAALGSATSLPSHATQAPVSLASLCTALSTPPSTASLASDHRSILAPTTAAATAAFSRSMTWTSDPHQQVTSPRDGCRSRSLSVLPEADLADLQGQEQQQQQQQSATCNASVAPAAASPPLPLIKIREAQVACKGLSGALKASTKTVAAAKTAATGDEGRDWPGTASKRGLYEGTVRCGSPRNTWRYCREGPRIMVAPL